MAIKRIKKKLRYKKERVLLSDTLPYELPLIFTNRGFYRYLVKNEIEVNENGMLRWSKKMPDAAFLLMKLLMNLGDHLKKSDGSVDVNEQKPTIPFNYKIVHKPTKPRVLSLVHPASQVKMVAFYEKYRSLMLHFTGKSKFSIRHPNDVACYFYYRDRLHNKLLGRKVDSTEQFFNEYENLRTYFSYQEFSNIYKFYESYRYQRAEKKYQHLCRLDLQSCFDSIYTHTITWAVNGGKNVFKEVFPFPGDDKTFGGEFDHLMQKMNFNETNGIVIGPEFSRIFTEIILQYIDTETERKALTEKGLKLKKDYEIYRYVDDYFIFYNEPKVLEDVQAILVEQLQDYKLRFGAGKGGNYDCPVVTDITRAKIRIDDLIDDNLTVRAYRTHQRKVDVEETEKDKAHDADEEEEEKNPTQDKIDEAVANKDRLLLNANEFNAKFKDIVATTGVEYTDVLNYTLMRIGIKTETLLKDFDKEMKILSMAEEQTEEVVKQKRRKERMLVNYLQELIDSIFFLYARSKKVNTTLKAIIVLNVILDYVQSDYHYPKEAPRMSKEARDVVMKKLRDEIALLFQTSTFNEYTQLEILYFLIVLKKMGSQYYMPQRVLNGYLSNKEEEKPKLNDLNMLSVLLLLYYWGNSTKYDKERSQVLEQVKKKYESVTPTMRRQYTELVMLTVELSSCPFVEQKEKHELLKLMGVEDRNERLKIIHYLGRHGFCVRWIGLNVTKELGAKISQEVYS